MRYEAPVRIDLAGGWTDVPPYSTQRGGAVVNVALALHVGVECRPRDEGIRIVSKDLGISVEAESPDALVYDGTLDLLKAAVRRSGLQGGWEVTTQSSAPAGGGLGSSGALGVALVVATRAAAGASLPPEEAAEEAHRLEVEEIGVAGGKQDQYAAALGGLNHFEFHDPTVGITRLSLEPAFIESLQGRTVLGYTGVSRVSGDTIARVMGNFDAGDARTVNALDGLRDAAAEARDALEAHDIERLADAVQRNWEHQRALDSGMATAEMKRIEAAAKEAGAIGGKATGAGAGGCMTFIAAEGHTDDVAESVRAAGANIIPVSFDMQGVRIGEDEE
jgi:D-glycero-alpha-D-manno-heptose-7-phosphate kinase